MIRYLTTVEGVDPTQLVGFFEGWPVSPSPETHLRLLQNSDEVVLARDEQSDAIVGFVTAVTDRVLAAYIPLLEVLSEYRGRGVGSELVRRMLHRLDGLYMVDLICDPDVQSFYESLGMRPVTGMCVRRFDFQSGS
jgi:ribosomal protein S18 acetylase RimI-like enzyme